MRAVPHAQLEDSWGYDGQWYAQLAVEPDVRAPLLQRSMDSPAYRARRILTAWTAHLLGMGDPARVLQVFAFQNVLCWGIVAGLLLRWLPPGEPRGFALWFACLFNEGFLTSTRSALFGGPTMLLLLLALFALERRRRWITVAILGAAGLVRETNLLAASLVAWPEDWDLRSLARRALSCALIALPLALWIGWLAWVFPDSWLAGGRRNFALPFSGYLWKWGFTIDAMPSDPYARYSLFALVALSVQWLYLAVRLALANPWWRLGAAYGLLLPVLGIAVWEGSPGAITRVLVPMTFAFNVLLAESKAAPRVFWPLAVAGNLGVVEGLSFVF